MPNETRDLVRPILVALSKQQGVWAARNNTGLLRDARGVPVRYGLGVGSADIVGCVLMGLYGRMLALEVKREGKRPTADQSMWLARVRRVGAYAAIVCSVDEALRAVDACRRGEL